MSRVGLKSPGRWTSNECQTSAEGRYGGGGAHEGRQCKWMRAQFARVAHEMVAGEEQEERVDMPDAA